MKRKNNSGMKRANQRVSSFTAKKRRGREIYDVKLNDGFKSKEDMEQIIDNIKTTFSDFPDEQVKITFYGKRGIEKASTSYIYNLEGSETKAENNETLREAIKDISRDIFTKRTPRDKTKSWQKIQPVKNYINKIIIDFETTD